MAVDAVQAVVHGVTSLVGLIPVIGGPLHAILNAIV